MKVRELIARISDPKYLDYDVKVEDEDWGFDLVGANIQFDDDNQEVLLTNGKV